MAEDAGALFRGVHQGQAHSSQKAISPDEVYMIERGCWKALGFEIGARSLRATAETMRLTTKPTLRKSKSPTFKVAYRKRFGYVNSHFGGAKIADRHPGRNFSVPRLAFAQIKRVPNTGLISL